MQHNADALLDAAGHCIGPPLMTPVCPQSSVCSSHLQLLLRATHQAVVGFGVESWALLFFHQ
jgi:hypothetical protein